MITSDVKLAGTTIGYAEALPNRGKPHIQSMVMATDRVGLKVGIDNKIFTTNPENLGKIQTIIQKEEAFSIAILKNNYNIGCLLSVYNNHDFRKVPKPTHLFNHYHSKNYFGMDIHPYEVIFIKLSGWTKHLLPSIQLYTKYHSSCPLDFNWKTYLQLNPDIAAKSNTESFAIHHWKHFGLLENRPYK